MLRSLPRLLRAIPRGRALVPVRMALTTPLPKKLPWAWLVVFAGAALGTTLYDTLNTKGEPVAAGDGKKPAPAFTPEQASVLFVLGGPGAGKGTQCARLVEEYGFVHLSAGDLLRAEQTRAGSKYGELIAKCIREGLIVPQEVTVALLRQAIGENVVVGKSKFLVDGFPRKMDQAITFEEEIVPLRLTLFFECPEQVMLARLLERGKTLGRADDNVESIKKRFRTFVDTLMPVVEHFRAQDKVLTVQCDSPVDTVYGQVKTALHAKHVV